MSPIKRSYEEPSYRELLARENEEGEDSSSPLLKRLRGGGGEDYEMNGMMEPMPEDDVDDDDDNMDQYDIPEEILEASTKVAVKEKDRVRWNRPNVPANLRTNARDLSIQWYDLDVYTGNALTQNPNRQKEHVVGQQEGQVPVLRAYGVNEDGHSVAAFIHGYTPYGYFAVPPGFTVDRSRLEEMRVFLEAGLKRVVTANQQASARILGISVVDGHKSIFGYQSPHNLFLKVICSLPGLIPKLRTLMGNGINLPGISGPDDGMSFQAQFDAYECNVPFVLRFMVDRGIGGAGWLTLPRETYQVRGDASKETHCQLEVDISYDDLIVRESEGEWNKIAPLRILSLDIECQGRKGHFPEAKHDPVIQIANCLTVYGQDQPIVQNVFTLKGCLPIVGAQVIPSEEEADMLMKWRAFLEAADPDIITGYNVQNFDIPYLLDRAEALGKRFKKLAGFPLWGRIKKSKAKMRDTTFQSAAYGKRNHVETTIEGRVIFDMLPYMQRNHKLSSYSLNSVCAEYLGQQKEDVHHSIISDLQQGSDEDRHRLAVYCLKDALLPQRLMDKLSVLVNYIEMARVTGVPMSFLISRGQQIKVYSMILRKCRAEKLLVPTLKKTGAPGGDVGYEGATVLDPIKNYYQVPIATLDFASLYPSIMQAYNLCYSTLVNPADVSKVDPSKYKRSENGHVFVHASVKKGILPTILEELLSARKRAKKDMKNAPTEFERAVQNGRQLALKVSANSVYGFTGATVGQLPCLPIASTTTSYGRMLLEKTKEFVESKYTVANGYAHDAQVVYGDTDSVMVKFGTETVKETFPLAIEAAEKASQIFPNPILLEFEKVYYPYLLM